MYTLLHKIQGITVRGHIGSPFFHILIRNDTTTNRCEEEKILQEIVDLASANGYLLTRSKYVSNQEISLPPASIRLAISAGFTKKEIERCANVFKDCVRKALKNNQKF
jgi:serine palmitoyltransferase